MHGEGDKVATFPTTGKLSAAIAKVVSGLLHNMPTKHAALSDGDLLADVEG